MLPLKNLHGPLSAHAGRAADDRGNVNHDWKRLVTISKRIEALEPDDHDLLQRMEITRDLSELNWSHDCLRRHLRAMVTPDDEATDVLLEMSYADLDEAVDTLLDLRDQDAYTAQYLLEGRIRSAISRYEERLREIKDREAAIDFAGSFKFCLEQVLYFHAFDCARLGGEDARKRLWEFTGVPALDTVIKDGKIKPTTGGVDKNRVRQQIAAAMMVAGIHDRSPVSASEEDTARIEALGITDLAETSLPGLQAVHLAGLQGEISRLMEEGKAGVPSLKKRIEKLESNKGKMRHAATKAFDDYALARSLLVCGYMAFILKEAQPAIRTKTGEAEAHTVPNSQAFVEEMLLGRAPKLVYHPPRYNAVFPRAHHRALRMTIVHDDRMIPPQYEDLKEDCAGCGDQCFEGPVTFKKIDDAFKDHLKSGEEVHQSEFLTKSNRLRDTALAKPDTPASEALLLEAQGRLWFRLRI